MSNFAWVTLTTNDAYSLGALVLAHSLKRVGTVHQLAVLVTPSVSEAMRSRLREVYDLVQEVNILDSHDAANLALLARPELGVTFTKLHAWKLVQFEKCVFLDSDILVIQNADELFEREELSAAPDVSWPDCFNSGVFVYRPNNVTFSSIIDFALKNGSFDGGDQGLLNLYFSDWAHTDITKHLPFIYNTTAFATYSYLPAFKQFRDKIKILHFAGKLKPWLLNFNSENKTAYIPEEFQHASDLIQLWWNIFCTNVHQDLSKEMNYWPKMEFRNVTTWTENHQHTSDSSSFNITNYDSGNFFDDIQPYHDPWEDYYEKLEKLIEQNSSNNNAISNNPQAQPPSSPPTTTTTMITATPPSSQLHVAEQKDSNLNLIPDFVSPQAPPLEQPAQKSHQHHDHHHQAHQPHHISSQFEKNLSNDNKNPSNFVQNVRKDNNSNVVQVSINADTHHALSANELNLALNVALDNIGWDNSSQISDTSNLDSNSISNSNESDNQEILVMEQTKSDKKLSVSEAGLAGALAQVRLGEPRSSEQEAYEASMRRQCWEAGNIDYSGRDSFENIWKKISQTLESKPGAPSKSADARLTSADIKDGKVDYDPVTKIRTQYKHVKGGYEVITTIPQDNGTVKTQVQTFYDPKPVTEEDLLKQQQEKKTRQKTTNQVVRIDKKTTMITREIPGGYEEVYTTVNDDGSKSMRTKTFYDAVEEEITDETTKVQQQKPKKNTTTKLTRTNTEEEEKNVSQKKTNRELVATNQRNVRQVDEDDDDYNVKHESTVEETRRVTKKTEITGKKTTIRNDSLQEENTKAITTTKDKKKKTKKAAPPPPADFVQNDTTTIVSKNVPGGVEYTYTTTLDSGKTISTSKTIYEEEEVELTEEEIRQYKKQLKDAEKHKNVTTTKKLRSESGTKKIVPSENPGDVTTVETIKIEGGTEYHYTTVTAEGIVKKAVKTVYDPYPVKQNPDDTDEEEYIEEYEEEIIEPGEKVFKTIETTKTLPQRFDEIVEKNTGNKKSSRLTRTDTEEEQSRMVQKKKNELVATNQKQSNLRQTEKEEHTSGRSTVRRESKVEETRTSTSTQKIKISGGKF